MDADERSGLAARDEPGSLRRGLIGNDAGASDIVVIGAGAKAAAIAAKVDAINRLGLRHIDLTIVEATEAAASWTGINGYTSGTEHLALSPAKDVGFPYESTRELGDAGEDIDAAIIPLSWQRYLISRGEYARWIDAGCPTVQHREYGRYLTWVLARATEGVRIVAGRVGRISFDGDRRGWLLDVEQAGEKAALRCEALVMTGPGVHRELPHDADAEGRIFYCDSRRPELARIPSDRACDIAIVGGGESALSSVLFLRSFRPKAHLTVYTPTLPMSRGESFLENRVFSTPDVISWETLSLQTRREFVKRCDRGVFGPDGLADIAYDDRYSFVVGKVTHIAGRDRSSRVAVCYDGLEGPGVAEHEYLVNCIGFDLLAQLRPLLDPEALAEVERHSPGLWDEEAGQEPRFGRALEVAGLRPRLHIPGPAALSQGPGFANLGCLGLLANRVLQPLYEERASQAAIASRRAAIASPR